VADLRSFAAGVPWDDRPGGLLARACEGSGIAALFGLPPALGLAAVGWGTAGWFGVRRRGRVAGLCGLTGLAVAVLGGPAAGAAYQRRAEAVRWRAAASLSVPTVNDWDRLYFGPVPPAFRRPDAWPAALGLVVDRNRSANALCEVADRVRRDRTDEAHGVRRRALAELERRADGADADDLVDLVAAACRRRDDPDLTRLKHRAAERLAVAAETHPDRFLLSHLVADVCRWRVLEMRREPAARARTSLLALRTLVYACKLCSISRRGTNRWPRHSSMCSCRSRQRRNWLCTASTALADVLSSGMVPPARRS